MTPPGLATWNHASEPPRPGTGTGPPRPGAPMVRCGMVPVLAEGFISRPETAPGLGIALPPGTAVALVPAAQVAGSFGKTQLAACTAEALWRSGQAEVLVWADASSRAAALSAYALAAAAVGVAASGGAEETALQFASWLAWTARPWLMVLDDLRGAADLDGLWPGGPSGRVVITTRHEQSLTEGTGGLQVTPVPVGGFSTREALRYLTGRLADDPDQRHGAIDLAAALGGDPCALAQASALITTTTQDCLDYRRHYSDAHARLTREAGSGPVTPGEVTWRLSADRAAQLCPGGGPWLLLALAALLDGQPIPGALFTTTAVAAYLTQAGAPASDDRAWDAVRALEHTGLLAIDTTHQPPLVRMPATVAALARDATPTPMAGQAARAAADALAEIWPGQEPHPWTSMLLRACTAALQHTSADRLLAVEGCHPVLARAGHSLAAAGLAGPAVSYWQQLTTTLDRLLGPDDPDTLTAGTGLAQALLAAGRPAEAAGWWQWATGALTRRCGPDHPATTAAQVSLGHALTAAGQPAEAITVLDQATASYLHTHGPAHPETLAAQDELAAAYQATGRHDPAIRCYQQTLAAREHAAGARDPAVITARENLAAACLAAGRLKDAMAGYKKALAAREHTLGPTDVATLATRCRLAAACQAAGKIPAALAHYEQASTGYAHALGPAAIQTLTAQASLAGAYQAAGRLTDAAALLRATLARCEEALPPGHPLTQTVRQALTGIAGPPPPTGDLR
jgi:tetratricopeptide (TPR) repeat protein